MNAALFHNREGVDTDKDFVYSTWLNALYYGNPIFRHMNEFRFRKNYQKVLDLILKQSSVSVCCLKDDHDVILGYSVTQSKTPHHILHFVFVKQAWRRMGIAKSLLPADITAVTHLTKTGMGMKPRNWEFDPFLI